MRLLRVITRGFKTYRDTTVIGEFDPRLNCIVGLNGSGKSSLFQAIIFVLSPDNTSSSFLHEGSTGKSQSGFVEIEFEESSNIDYPENSFGPVSVKSLRRTISADQPCSYMVNGEHVSKADYIVLLQSVGLLGGKNFSSSSPLPYFVVEQGRIVSVATVSDKHRFELVKEACGIDVFSSKKIESLKILNETKSKRDRINELLADIDSRCEQLEKESGELVEYSRVEKERDIVAYQIGMIELKNLEQKRERLEGEMRTIEGKIFGLEEEQAELVTRKSGLEKFAEESSELVEIRSRKSQLEETKKILSNQIRTLTDQLDAERENLKKNESSIETLKAQLSTVENRRLEVTNAIEKDKEEMNVIRADLADSKSKKSKVDLEIEAIERMGSSADELMARKNQLSLLLSSLGLRGRNLESQIRMKENESRVLESGEIPRLTESVADLVSKISTIESVRDSQLTQIGAIEDEKNKIQRKIFELKSQKLYAHQKQIDIMTKEISTLRNSVFRGERKSLSVEAKSDPSFPKGVLGFFGDYVKIPSHYRRAVQICSKNGLFNLVIESEEIADKLVPKLGTKFGRLTLLPINQVGDCGKESELVGKIESDPEFKDRVKILSSVISPVGSDEAGGGEWVKKLILKFFSKVAVVENVEVGFALSKKYGIDSITPEGDWINKHLILRSAPAWTAGTIGGDSGVSSWQQMVGLRKKLAVEKSGMETVMAELKHLDSRMFELDSQLEQISVGTPPVPTELKSELCVMRKNLDQILQRKSDLFGFEIVAIREEIGALEAERKRAEEELVQVESQLANPDQQQPTMSKREKETSVGELKNLSKTLVEKIDSLETKLSRMGKTVSVNQSELIHFIGNKISSLEELVRERSASIELGQKITLPKLERELEILRFGEFSQVEKECEELCENEKLELAKSEASRTELETVNTRIDELSSVIKSLVGDKSEIERKKESIDLEILSVKTNSIRKLTSLPPDIALSEDLSLLKSQMLDLVKLLNSPQFEVLNKNAVEQYEKISNERQQLNVRRAEIEQSDSAIRSLLEEVNLRELKLIKDSYSKIQSSFENLFRRVTGGLGKAEISLEIDADGTHTNVTEIHGSIRIRVGFPSEANLPLEWKGMAELSGGQRTVVALCYLLSLHRAGESSRKFFILDEVDAALDSVYRSGIAEAVRQDSRDNGTQFLFTSFRAELASVADRHFLVTMARGTSRVDSIDLPTALSLVNLQESSNEGKLGASTRSRAQSVAVRE